MGNIEEQIKEIEEEIFNTQKNKATEHHIGKLKAKLAKLRAQLELHKIKAGGGGRGYYIKKSGDATVALVGYPSVGKSSLLNVLTDKVSEVGAYEFTTLEVIPGIMEYKGAKIQILDMPGLIRGASKGKGRGKEVITAARAADIIILLGDVYNYRIDVLKRELISAAIRMNENPPNIHISPASRGGIVIRRTVRQTHMTDDEISEILRVYGTVNATIVLREDVTHDRLVDFLADNRVYIPALTVINKYDLVYDGVDEKIREHVDREFFKLSVVDGSGIEELKELIFNTLGFMRIYLKPQGGKADMEEPLVILDDSTVRTVCEHLHRDFVDRFRFAYVWGDSAKYPGQSVGLNHRLVDGDILSIIIRKR
ncbi:MAG: OBG GTPase family GTP-binding protein [Thermoplasmatota archaeon]